MKFRGAENFELSSGESRIRERRTTNDDENVGGYVVGRKRREGVVNGVGWKAGSSKGRSRARGLEGGGKETYIQRRR